MQTKAKEDVITIEKRKRMLQTFLNRLAKHPQLSSKHVFHRFLESGVSWVFKFLVIFYHYYKIYFLHSQ